MSKAVAFKIRILGLGGLPEVLYEDLQSMREIEAINKEIIRILQSNPHELIADLGCGLGRMAIKILEKITDARMICVDDDPEYIGQAQKNLWGSSYGHRVDIITGKIEKLSYFQIFDAAICLFVLRHNSNQYGILKSIREMLKPGGILLLGDKIKHPAEDNFALSPEELESLAKRVGFKSCEQIYPGKILNLFQLT